MPKITTSGEASNEPMYATVPIRMSARATRFPRRFSRTEWVATSYMPSLSAPPQTSEYQWQEDVTMHAPTAQAAIKQEPGAEELDQVMMNLEISSDSRRAEGRGIKSESSDAEVRIALESLSLESQGIPAIDARNNHLTPKVEGEEPALAPIPRHPGEPRRFDEAEERFRLEHAIGTIDALNARIDQLQKTEQRLKKQLKEEKERLKNSKAKAEGALSLLVMAEEKICEVEGMMAFLRQDVERYRQWWLTEYYSLKAVVAMLPRGSRNGVVHIAEAAHARFAAFSTRG